MRPTAPLQPLRGRGHCGSTRGGISGLVIAICAIGLCCWRPLLGLALACGGCSSGRPTQGVLIPVAAAAEGTSRVQVLAATTRRRSTTDAGAMFGGERARGRVLRRGHGLHPARRRSARSARCSGRSRCRAIRARNFVTVAADHVDKRGLQRRPGEFAQAGQAQQGAGLRAWLQQPVRRCGLPFCADRA